MSKETATFEIENMEDAHVVAEMLADIEDTPQYESSSVVHGHESKALQWKESMTVMRQALRSGATGSLSVSLEVEGE